MINFGTTARPSDAGPPLIQLAGVTKSYDQGEVQVNALRGVELTIGRAELVAIIGPSGSGRSTLMHILGCLDQPTSGTFMLDGEDVSARSSFELAAIRNRKIGFVFQTTFCPRPRSCAMSSCPCSTAASPPPSGMTAPSKHWRASASGSGQGPGLRNSRAGNGNESRSRAIVMNPRLILTDEPTGNLDTRTGNKILQIFDEMHWAGHTIAIVTHDPRIAERCHRVMRIEDGAILLDARQKAV